MNMKFCPNCGDEADPAQKFCEKCGNFKQVALKKRGVSRVFGEDLSKRDSRNH